MRVALIGCGRSGSVLAEMLVRVGLRRLVLIDPDDLEEHNLGEMAGVVPARVGLPKVTALAEYLQLQGRPGLELSCVAEPLWAPAALEAAKRCDVLVVAVDQDAARLAAAIMGTLYHRVLVDCATGIQIHPLTHSPSSTLPPPRTMGADVRLIVPGDGCLLCRGSLSHYGNAIESLCRQPLQAQGGVRWRQQRAGSLRSLNTTAAGVAMRLLEDLVTEQVTGSMWARLDFDSAGRLSASYPGPALLRTGCPLCAKAGLGDAGLHWG